MACFKSLELYIGLKKIEIHIQIKSSEWWYQFWPYKLISGIENNNVYYENTYTSSSVSYLLIFYLILDNERHSCCSFISYHCWKWLIIFLVGNIGTVCVVQDCFLYKSELWIEECEIPYKIKTDIPNTVSSIIPVIEEIDLQTTWLVNDRHNWDYSTYEYSTLDHSFTLLPIQNIKFGF